MRRRGVGRLLTAGCVAALSCAAVLLPSSAAAAVAGGPDHWVGDWGTSLQDSAATANELTYREIVHTSVAGSVERVRVSNAFGSQPLTLGAASLGIRDAGAAVKAGTNRQLTFGGSPSVTVAPGAQAQSDPVELGTVAGQDLAVSLYVHGQSGPATSHPQALTTSYLTPAGGGNAAAAEAGTAFTQTTSSWWFLQAVDVLAPAGVSTVVAIGDSITDGYQTSSNANNRWPDVLARRLAAAGAGQQFSVVNMGLTGNEVTLDRAGYGQSVLHRLSRDVLAEPGVGTVILFEGINDIGNDGVLATAIETADAQAVAQLHAAGLRVLGATLTPSGGSVQYGTGYTTPQGLQQRDALNAWIRASGTFDGVLDFDAVLRNAVEPEILDPAYDSTDHLHPNDAGHAAMGNSVELAELAPEQPVASLPEAPWPAALLLVGLLAAMGRRRPRSRTGDPVSGVGP